MDVEDVRYFSFDDFIVVLNILILFMCLRRVCAIITSGQDTRLVFLDRKGRYVRLQLGPSAYSATYYGTGRLGEVYEEVRDLDVDVSEARVFDERILYSLFALLLDSRL